MSSYLFRKKDKFNYANLISRILKDKCEVIGTLVEDYYSGDFIIFFFDKQDNKLKTIRHYFGSCEMCDELLSIEGDIEKEKEFANMLYEKRTDIAETIDYILHNEYFKDNVDYELLIEALYSRLTKHKDEISKDDWEKIELLAIQSQLN